MSIINWFKKNSPKLLNSTVFLIYIYFLQYVFHQCWLLYRIFGSIYINFFSCLLRLVSLRRMCFHQPISFVMWLQNMQNRSIFILSINVLLLNMPQAMSLPCADSAVCICPVSHDPHCWALIYRPVIVLNVIDFCWDCHVTVEAWCPL